MPRGKDARLVVGHGDPTAKQREAWETVERLGSQIAACAELGISQGAIQTRLTGYMRAMGIEGGTPGASRHPTGTGVVGRLRATVAERDATIADLTDQVRIGEDVNRSLLDRIAELEIAAHPWGAIHEKLDRLMARPVVMAAPTHRRQADGGIGGRQERKAARKAVA
jgi:hypothetical protein